MKRDTEKENKTEFPGAEYPSLRDFFSGYLHEDFQEEYGSAADAVRAFCRDASIEEVSQTREEWAKLRKSLRGRTISELRGILLKLGGAWRPEDEDDLRGVDAALAERGQE